MQLDMDIRRSDHVNYKISDEKCSRCREDIAEGDGVLRLWSKIVPDYMWIYCGKCSPDLVKSPSEKGG